METFSKSVLEQSLGSHCRPKKVANGAILCLMIRDNQYVCLMINVLPHLCTCKVCAKYNDICTNSYKTCLSYDIHTK